MAKTTTERTPEEKKQIRKRILRNGVMIAVAAAAGGLTVYGIERYKHRKDSCDDLPNFDGDAASGYNGASTEGFMNSWED
jgi:uncharacterized membrane protein YkoI